MTERMEVWCKRLHKAYSHIPLVQIEAIISAILYDYKTDKLMQAEAEVCCMICLWSDSGLNELRVY